MPFGEETKDNRQLPYQHLAELMGERKKFVFPLSLFHQRYQRQGVGRTSPRCRRAAPGPKRQARRWSRQRRLQTVDSFSYICTGIVSVGRRCAVEAAVVFGGAFGSVGPLVTADQRK